MSDPTPMTKATAPATPRRAPTKVAKARPPTKTTARNAKTTARTAKAGGTKSATRPTKASKRATKLPTAGGAIALTQSVLPVPLPRARTRRIRDAVPAAPPAVTLPVIGWTVPLPGPNSIPWIAGLGIVAALEIIDWPVAMLLAVGHTVMTNSKNQQLRELAEGIESAL